MGLGGRGEGGPAGRKEGEARENKGRNRKGWESGSVEDGRRVNVTEGKGEREMGEEGRKRG